MILNGSLKVSYLNGPEPYLIIPIINPIFEKSDIADIADFDEPLLKKISETVDNFPSNRVLSFKFLANPMNSISIQVIMTVKFFNRDFINPI